MFRVMAAAVVAVVVVVVVVGSERVAFGGTRQGEEGEKGKEERERSR